MVDIYNVDMMLKELYNDVKSCPTCGAPTEHHGESEHNTYAGKLVIKYYKCGSDGTEWDSSHLNAKNKTS